MGLTPEQIGALTLVDLEAIGERFGSALKTIRDAQALLGGGPVAIATTGIAAPVAPVRHLPPTRTMTPLTPGEAEEMARQRDMLVKQNRADDEFPDSIAAAMGGR